MIIPFGPWQPDLPALDNPGVMDARNVVPGLKSYEPWRRFAQISGGAMDARCLGAGAAIDNAGAAHSFGGDATKLYRMNSTGFADVSKAGGYTAAARWEFVLFSDLVVAADIGQPLQSWAMSSSTAFADLAASAPKAAHIATVGDFLMVGNVDDTTDGKVPNRVQWGPIGNPGGNWADIQVQADKQDLPDAGPVRRIVGGEYASIFCENGIHRGIPTGGDTIFQFDHVVVDKGCVASGSVAGIGKFRAFLSEDGFYSFDGQGITPIGANKVDTFFLNDVDSSRYSEISASIDPYRKLYVVSYPDGYATADQCNKVVIYNWQTDRWSYADEALETLAQLLNVSRTLEDLDSVSSTLEGLPASLDSRIWVGGAPIFGGVDTSHKFGVFTGDPRDGLIETGERYFNPGYRSSVPEVRPLVDGSCTVQVGVKAYANDTVTWTTAKAPNNSGLATNRKGTDGRYHRFRLNTSGEWTHAQGLEVMPKRAGLR